MVNVTKGVLVECDPAMKQFLLHLDEKNALGRKFVIQDLDDTHLFISSDIIEILQTLEEKESIWPTFPIKRHLKANHILFEDGDLACIQNIKTIPVELSQLPIKKIEEFPCSISGCGKIFDSLLGYESHYNTQHRNCCSVCKRVFPSNYLLELHLLEWHDSMFEILAAKQNMYKCLVESCQALLQSSKTRKKHMIEKHHFPSNYRFDRVKKNAPSKQPLKEKKNDNSMEVEVPVNQSQPSKRIFSYKVPNNICFGQGSMRGFNRRGRGRGGRHWHQVNKTKDTSVDIENVVMKDLNDALES